MPPTYSNPSKIYIIDLETGALVNIVDGVDYSNASTTGYTPHRLSNGLYEVCKSNYPMDIYIWDSVNNTLKPIGLGDVIGERSEALDVMHPTNGGIYKNPLYLATINNLNSPVTKTAAQTMKVTYILTET